jgi:hypothetical protein
MYWPVSQRDSKYNASGNDLLCLSHGTLVLCTQCGKKALSPQFDSLGKKAFQVRPDRLPIINTLANYLRCPLTRSYGTLILSTKDVGAPRSLRAQRFRYRLATINLKIPPIQKRRIPRPFSSGLEWRYRPFSLIDTDNFSGFQHRVHSPDTFQGEIPVAFLFSPIIFNLLAGSRPLPSVRWN